MSILLEAWTIFNHAGALLSSVCLKTETEKPTPIVWHSAHWEPKMQHVWRGALLLLSLIYFFEVFSKASQNPDHVRGPCLHLNFSYSIPNPETAFLSFLTVDNWAWGAVLWAVSQTPARDTQLRMEACSPAKGAWIWFLARVQLQHIIHMITASWGDEAHTENIIMLHLWNTYEGKKEKF